MHYDPIKKYFGSFVGSRLWMRKLFYMLLELLLLRTWHIKHELRKWSKSKPHDMEVLDAGFGYGQYSYWLVKKYKSYKITGLDVKQEQVDDCNVFFAKSGHHNANFITGDLTLYKQANSYDLVLSVDVMEHIVDDESVFSNFYQSLKPGGMLLISTPSDQGGSDVHKNDQTSFIEEHVRKGYNILEIREKLSTAGFETISARYQYGFPGSVSWRLSIKYPLLILGASKIFLMVLPLYYLFVFPFCLILNFADLRLAHKTGTGLIVKAWKKQNEQQLHNVRRQ